VKELKNYSVKERKKRKLRTDYLKIKKEIRKSKL